MTVDITHLRGRRYVPPVPPEEWARKARAVLDNRSVVRGFMEDPLDPVGNVRRTVPDAWRIFGEATVTAAAASLASGSCRWCYARSLAGVHRLPVPLDTPAVRLLLGQPCDACFRACQPPTRTSPARRRAGASRDPGFVAAVRRGPPTEVRPVPRTDRNLEAMRRMGIRPETYFTDVPRSAVVATARRVVAEDAERRRRVDAAYEVVADEYRRR